MDLALLAARILLAAVFVVAGLAKLADLPGSRQAVRDFGVPAAAAGPLGTLLPFSELMVAAALLPVPTAWFGAVGALGLLGAFIIGIGANMARGRAPECHCFGQLHSEPAGWRTLLRNIVLGIVAAFLVVQGPTGIGPSIIGWIGDLTPDQGLVLLISLSGAVVLAAFGLILLNVLRQQGRLLRRLELLESQFASGGLHSVGLPVGTPAPAFSLSDLEGQTVSLDGLLSKGLPLLLLFWDPGCGPCRLLLPAAARWQREHADTFTLVPISRGSVGDNRAMIGKHHLTGVLLQKDREVDELYQVDGTPSAVLVRADGTIAGPQAGGGPQIESFVAGLAGLLGESPLLSAAPSAGDGRSATHPHEADGGASHAGFKPASSA